ncbi:hypothetical protein GCM10008982_12490 [Anoxybacillus voinovskiensis]|nr:hypothetical protein GCM10008982_12490 [Anoxybacillus voinovskiensis]
MITLIQEKYNETLTAPTDESAEDKSFRLGSNFAYFDVFDLIESQLTIHEINSILGL